MIKSIKKNQEFLLKKMFELAKKHNYNVVIDTTLFGNGKPSYKNGLLSIVCFDKKANDLCRLVLDVYTFDMDINWKSCKEEYFYVGNLEEVLEKIKVG